MLDYPPFPGFRPQAFDFLRELASNNTRDWFKARKTTYEDEVAWPLRCLVVDASRQASSQDLPFNGHPRNSLFRISRDTRFSRNKQPYKTHAGAVLSRSGTRKDSGVVYIHVEPGTSFLGAGFWRPDNAFLRAWRSRVADAPEAFLSVVRGLAGAGLALENNGETLKRTPRGFSHLDGTEVSDYLRWKSFTVSRPITDEALQEPAFTTEVVRLMRDGLPLLDWGWQVIDTTGASA